MGKKTTVSAIRTQVIEDHRRDSSIDLERHLTGLETERHLLQDDIREAEARLKAGKSRLAHVHEKIAAFVELLGRR